MAQTIYSVLGSLDSIPVDYQPFVVTVCLVLIALLICVCVDAVLRFFGWLFSHMG